jgi:P22 coat protein - gene protein 5
MEQIPTLNRQYEGELAAGNTVKITGITTPSVQNYATTRTLTIDALSDSTQSLVIDKEEAISFKVDDVDRVQAAGSFEPVTADAGAALMENAESTVIAAMKANGTSAGTAAITTSDLAFAAMGKIRTALTKAKVPSTGRYLAVSPEFAELLLSSGSKLTSVDQAGSDGELRNGVLGRLLGFTVIEHPLLTHTSNRPCAIGYHGPSMAYVGQIDKVESGRMELAFADYIRALNVYGTKVLRATAVQTYLPAS